MRAARHDTDPLSVERRGGFARWRGFLRHGETRRQAHEGARKGETLAQLRRDGNAGRDGLAIAVDQRLFQLRKGHRLDLAFVHQRQLPADFPHQIDMEAGKLAGLIDEIEGWKIHGGEEAQAHDAREIGLGDALARIEQDWQIDRRFLLGRG